MNRFNCQVLIAAYLFQLETAQLLSKLLCILLLLSSHCRGALLEEGYSGTLMTVELKACGQAVRGQVIVCSAPQAGK